MHHYEGHRTERIGWLRAAVLGANDGIVSTSSLVIGVAAGGAAAKDILLAGVAGLVAGALAMATGEYVSVCSQADTERADTERERKELEADPEAEEKELAGIYMQRGLDPELAQTVARKLMEHDALGAHLRDELGHTEILLARPLQAALSSAATFTAGAALPLLTVLLSSRAHLGPIVACASLVCLAALGALAAKTGGARAWVGAARVSFWSALAMAATAGVGALFGTTFA